MAERPKSSSDGPTIWPLWVFFALVAITAVFSDDDARGFIKDFQTLIGAAVGFGGLIYVTHLGFQQARESREHAAELERQRDDERREKEARALAAALAAEFLAAITWAPHFVKSLEALIEADDGHTGVPDTREEAAELWTPFLHVLDANLSRLGILGAELDDHVIYVARGLKQATAIRLSNLYGQDGIVTPQKQSIRPLQSWIDAAGKLVADLRKRAGLPEIEIEGRVIFTRISDLTEDPKGSASSEDDPTDIPPDADGPAPED